MPTADTSPEDLAERMVGRKVLLRVEKAHGHPRGRRCWKLKDLNVIDDAGVHRLKDVSLSLRAGEILGVAGVAGNGQSELLNVLGGSQAATGTAQINGAAMDLSGKANTGQTRRAMGIAHVPEDRQREGLIMDFHAWENIAFGYHHDPAYQRGRWLMDNRAIGVAAAEKMARFDVRPAKSRPARKKFLRRQSAENRIGAGN